jgi:adenine-specific DNA-methyltransferase
LRREGQAVSNASLDLRSIQKVPYLSRQIIPYIGNKRRLIPLIHRGLLDVFPRGFRGKTFLDPFAGSGVVSRFAKYLGFEVFSNDWEVYSYLCSFAYLKINRRDLLDMYARWGGMDGMLAHINNLPPPAGEDEYIARYYSPRDDTHADYRRERLFYTRVNGCTIDGMRNEIERLYPFSIKARSVDAGYSEVTLSEDGAYREKVLLLALLLHGAATHTNTSGVFKAYHKGFGGFTGDALSRIMKPIVLRLPVLWDSDQPQHIFMLDAVLLLEHLDKQVFDIAYLDPPYNQHQYGSNYHLLNTIALWDGTHPGDRGKGGKAGIRKDWILTRSDYCYRDRAPRAFGALLDRLRARYIVISYSTEGIIPFDVLIELCASHGKVSLLTNEYVKYRGGRQSIHRLNHNVEFIIIIDTSRRTVPSDLKAIGDAVTARKLNLQTKRSYVRTSLQQHFAIDTEYERVGFMVGDKTLWIETWGFLKLEETDLGGLIDHMGLTVSQRRKAKERLLAELQQCQCRDRVEELQEVMGLVTENRDDRQVFAALIPDILRKIAHRKYREIFMDSLTAIRGLERRIPTVYGRIASKIDDIEELARKRFAG